MLNFTNYETLSGKEIEMINKKKTHKFKITAGIFYCVFICTVAGSRDNLI